MRKLLALPALLLVISILLAGTASATPIIGGLTSNVFVDTFNTWNNGPTSTDAIANWWSVACATCAKGAANQGTGTMNQNTNGDIAPFDAVDPGYGKLKDTGNLGFWMAAPDVFANSVNPVDLSHFDGDTVYFQ